MPDAFESSTGPDALEQWVRAESSVDQPATHAEAQAWARAAHGPKPNVATLRPYRCLVAWRLTRLVARARGVIGATNLLADAPAAAWSDGDHGSSSAFGTDYYVQALQAVLRRPGGVPLTLPAEINPQDPAHEWLLERFDEAYGHAAEALDITSHTLGRLGMLGLFNYPEGFPLWPSPEELFSAESAALDVAWDILVDEGPTRAAAHMVEKHGLHPHEAREIVAVARARAAATCQPDVEEARVVLLERLERLQTRARSAFDLRTERTALKDVANVLGLTRTAPEDLVGEVVKAMKRITAEPAPRLIDVQADLVSARALIPEKFKRPERREVDSSDEDGD